MSAIWLYFPTHPIISIRHFNCALLPSRCLFSPSHRTPTCMPLPLPPSPPHADPKILPKVNCENEPLQIQPLSPRRIRISGLNQPLDPNPNHVHESAPDEERRAHSTTALVRPSRRPLTQKKRIIKAVEVEFSSEEDKVAFLAKMEDAVGLHFRG